MAIKNEMRVQTKDGEMKVCVIDITPRKAGELLTLNTNNRNLRSNRIKTYALDMASGNWKQNGMPIIIGNDGELKDGQHRLKACMKSGKTLKNTIVIYLPKKNANCYDIGANRNAKDVAKFMGLTENPLFNNSNIFSAVHVAIEGGRSNKGYSKMQLLTEMQNHLEACEYIYNKIMLNNKSQKNKLRKAGVIGAIFNAYINNYDLDKLDRFCDVYLTGICKSETDSTIIELRDYSITSEYGKEKVFCMYNMAQAALYALANDEVNTKLSRSTTEYYPYPNRVQENEDGQLTFE